MNDKRPKKDSVEVASQSIEDKLDAINDRLNAIETIQTISNEAVVKQYVLKHLTTDKSRAIMQACEEPRTRSYLVSHFNFNSGPALDHHLKPLRRAELLRQRIESDGTILFEWSKLFESLPKSAIKSILEAEKATSKGENGNGHAKQKQIKGTRAR